MLLILYPRTYKTSAIRDVQVKCDEAYIEYGEEHFAQYNEEVCRFGGPRQTEQEV
jgi:hypothetical protein